MQISFVISDTIFKPCMPHPYTMPTQKTIQKVARCVEKIAPKECALSWDNTGILIDSNTPESSQKKVLLTIDFTLPVLSECVEKNIKYVVSYHPVIFRPLKKIDDRLLISCIQNCISIYSPHTQLDPLMNSYLLKMIGPNPGNFEDVLQKIKEASGLKHLRIVKSSERVYKNDGDIVAGVGAAFRNVDLNDCMLITGEMSHHDLLKCKFSGVDVIMMEHSNSERIFLGELKRQLESDDEMKGFEIVNSNNDVDPVRII